MSLDLTKVQNLKPKHGENAQIGRCPACAECGNDKKGEHLIVYDNGAYSCIVDQSAEHKRRIQALAGGVSVGSRVLKFKLKAVVDPQKNSRSILLGRVGRAKSILNHIKTHQPVESHLTGRIGSGIPVPPVPGLELRDQIEVSVALLEDRKGVE